MSMREDILEYVEQNSGYVTVKEVLEMFKGDSGEHVMEVVNTISKLACEGVIVDEIEPVYGYTFLSVASME